jgi:hypothetical protein
MRYWVIDYVTGLMMMESDSLEEVQSYLSSDNDDPIVGTYDEHYTVVDTHKDKRLAQREESWGVRI